MAGAAAQGAAANGRHNPPKTQRRAGWHPTLFCLDSHPGLAMAATFQLRFRAPQGAPVGDCAFCARPCEPDGGAVQVWYGTSPRGSACSHCLAAAPGDAARHLRRRAAQARDVADRSAVDDPGGRWEGLRQQLGNYAEELEALAAAVAGLSAWPAPPPPG